jgi:predicted N-acetyltransferase YhbS
MIGPAQPEDKDELARLYRSNHPAVNGWLEPEVRHETQTFVARDDDGQVIGLALVSCIDYGLYPYGVIHELEVAAKAGTNTIGHSLIEACMHWLTEHGAALVSATASDARERAFYRGAGFKQSAGKMHRLVPPRPIQAAFHTYA